MDHGSFLEEGHGTVPGRTGRTWRRKNGGRTPRQREGGIEGVGLGVGEEQLKEDRALQRFLGRSVGSADEDVGPLPCGQWQNPPKVSGQETDVVINGPFHRLTGQSYKDGGEDPEGPLQAGYMKGAPVQVSRERGSSPWVIANYAGDV